MSTAVVSTPFRSRMIWIQGLCLFLLLAMIKTTLADVGKPMRFDHLGMGDGLSQSSVLTLHQDSTGFLWIGTQNGLNRYDGYEFHHYKRNPDDPESLGADFIYNLSEDNEGNIWIATNGGGVSRWNADQDNFTHFRYSSDSESISSDVVRAVLYTDDGSIWVGTQGSGLDRINLKTDTIDNFRHDENNSDSLGGDKVFALALDSHGILWIATDNGLSRFDPISKAFKTYRFDAEVPHSISSDKVRAIFEDRLGNIWIGTRNAGINRFDRNSETFVRFKRDANDSSTISHNSVRAIFEDDAGRLWIGTTKGLNLYDRERNRFFHYTNDRSDPGSLSDSYIRSIFQDRSGILWIGTQSKGVNKWNPRSWGFGHFSPSRLSEDIVTSFAEDRNKTLWVGTFGGGVNKINRSSGEVIAIKKNTGAEIDISDNRIMSLLADSRDNLWLGTMIGGLDRYDVATGETENFRHDKNDPTSLSSNGIMSLFEDRDGNLWIGTFGGGVNRMSPDGTIRRFPFQEGLYDELFSARATAFSQDDAGNIWIGTDRLGLTVFEPSTGNLHKFRHDIDNSNSVSADTVYAIHRDINGNMWIGTHGGGLTSAVGDFKNPAELTFKRFIPVSGPTINNVVYGIESDTRGNLWLSTNYGLSQYTPSTGKVQNFHRSHGLQDEEFNSGAHYRSTSGQLYFGGANGFNAFYPSDLEINTVAPRVVLTQLSLLNKPVDTGKPHWLSDELQLDYTDDVLSIEFSALDFAAPSQNRFAYMLEGFDPDWIEAGTKHDVTYTNLDAGDYRFKIKAANSDGVWQTESIKMHMNSVAPPWQRGWAYALYALLVVGVGMLIWLAHQRQLRQEAEFRRRLEKDVQIRTKELAERNGELKQLNQRFLQASITDPLTGLRNRRFVFEEIAKDIDVVRRRYRNFDPATADPEQSDFIFMMIDLDNFKPVNDTCGHSAGDEMLLQIRDLLISTCRSSDVVIRWGGDEFLVIGRYSDLRQGEALAERIRSRMANSVFSVGNGQATRTTCSIGLAGFPFTRLKPDLLDWEQLLSLADKAMYRAKAYRNAWMSLVSTELSPNVINPFYSFRDHTDAMVEQGMLEIRSSRDEEAEQVAEA